MGNPLSVTQSVPARESAAGGSWPCRCGAGGNLVEMGRASDATRRCRTCDLIVPEALPAEKDLARCYGEDYWAGYMEEQQGTARDNLWIHIVDRIAAAIPVPGTLVDVGCGGGGFLARCRERGWKGIGFELSVGAAQHARQRQLDVRLAGWPPCELADSSVQVVSMINVLDHLADPFAALKEAWRILAPGGLLYLRVPNGPLHTAVSRASRMAGLPDLSIRHLFGFGAMSLRFHLARTGFEALTIVTSPPTQADAYRRPRGHGARLREFCKRADLAVYRCARRLGVDRFPYGLSLEAMARKPVTGGRECRP